jgi:hypothetical protein
VLQIKEIGGILFILSSEKAVKMTEKIGQSGEW